MLSISNASWLHNSSFLALVALGITILGIMVLLIAILIRRMFRKRFLLRRDLRAIEMRQNWSRILSMEISPKTWLSDTLDRSIVEDMLLDRMDVAGVSDFGGLRQFALSSGLFDRRVWEVRHLRGWRRRRALLALGRMQIAEGIPAVVEAARDEKASILVDAICSLGKIGTPYGADAIFGLLVSCGLSCPPQTLQIALVNCYRDHSLMLLKKIQDADDVYRPLLARVLAEVADRTTTGDLLPLTLDPLPEVRASAARALGAVRASYSCTALMKLAADEEWFVRLRAVVALGDLADFASIRALVRALCDSNRLVRLRAAAALARFEGQETRIFHLTVQTRDRYALQALVSEMERSGRIPELVNSLGDSDRRPLAESALVAALRGGSARILIDLWLHHPDRQIRRRLARLLAGSGDQNLLQQLEQVSLSTATRQQVRLLRWLILNLHKAPIAAASGPVVAA